MKNVCLINGSLRGKQAASLAFIQDIAALLPAAEFNKTTLTVKVKVKGSYPQDMLETMAAADALVFVFPLHNYGLPGALMRLLEDYNRYALENRYNKNASVYMVVNYGFPRPAVSEECIRVMKNFCRRFGYNWRFAVCIGTGPVVVMEKKIPLFHLKLKKAFREMAADIKNNGIGVKTDFLIKPVLPEAVIAVIKRRYEKSGGMIKKR